MTKSEWENLKQRILRDFPGFDWECDKEPMFDGNGELTSFPWSCCGEDYWPLLDIFGMCGCGDPESVIKTYYHPFLKAIKADSDRIRSSSFEQNMLRSSKEQGEAIWKALNGEKVNHTCFKIVEDQALEYLILYALDHFQLTEHGSFIGGCWLTKKGETALMMCDAIFGASEEAKGILRADASDSTAPIEEPKNNV